jgi:hypothetical protein
LPNFTAKDIAQLVATLERQTNLFDGRELQIGLGLKVVAHGGEQPRMLQVQTLKNLYMFNDNTNIRTGSPQPKSMMTNSFAFSAGH